MADLTNASDAAIGLNDAVTKSVNALSDEQRANLSKVLFPETHTGKAVLLGKPRELRPLPVKFAKKLGSLLNEFQINVEKGRISAEGVTGLDLLDPLASSVRVLAEFYKWEDVLAEMDEMENITTSEMQGAVVEQVHLQEVNDFLLMPLRVLVGMMQFIEIEMKNLQSTFSGLLL